ncbi:hypothetical protein IH601_10090 [Candidatus Bipolaricaulota bacterium]|nr:hypothetical protein [Candidatus Bipolaricaulota bacterium]
MMNGDRFENEVAILRTSVPEDLARAADALDAAEISYRVESIGESFLLLGGRVHEVNVDAWHEEAARQAVGDIPTEFEVPMPLGEDTERSERTMPSAYGVAFFWAIVILVVAFLWWRFL